MAGEGADRPAREARNEPALRGALATERARRVSLEAEVGRLRGAVARQNATLDELRTAVARLTRQQAALGERLTAMTAHGGALQTEVARLQGENAALRTEATRLQAANARLRAALVGAGGGGDEVAGGEGNASGSAPAPPAGPDRPPTWVKAKTPRPPGGKRPRRRRAAEHNHGRRRVVAAEADVWVRHAPAVCPHCTAPLRGGWVHRRVQVIDLPPPAKAVVTEHLLVARRCGACQRRVLPPPLHPPQVPVARVGQCRFGPRVLAALAIMRTVERLPLTTIRTRLAREHELRLSHGGLVRLLRQVARHATPAYERLREAVRASPVVHADETGWREDGQHGSVWTFSTPSVRYFHHALSRGGEVAATVLDDATFTGTLVTDFYAAYDRFAGPHQRCWAHLWRDIEELVRQHPDDARLTRWVASIRTIYKEAIGPPAAPELGDPSAAAVGRHARADGYERQLLALCPATLPSDRPEAVLAQRIRRYLQELFTFVRDPAVPSTNNAAERSLRPLVVARKISGGTRSPAGSRDRMVLASVLGTAQVRGDDLTATCFQFLVPGLPTAHTV
jgi:transposase